MAPRYLEKFVNPHLKHFLQNERTAGAPKILVVLLLAGLAVLVEVLGVLMKGEYPIWQSGLWDKNLVWVDVRDLNSVIYVAVSLMMTFAIVGGSYSSGNLDHGMKQAVPRLWLFSGVCLSADEYHFLRPNDVLSIGLCQLCRHVYVLKHKY